MIVPSRSLRVGLRIENHTDYRTGDLKRLFLAGLRALGASSDKVIRVRYTRENRPTVRGCAQLGNVFRQEEGFCRREANWAEMRLPRDPSKLEIGIVARVFEHEVLHLMGVDHRAMTRAQRFCEGATPAWAEGRTLRVRAVTLKARLTLDEKREARRLHLQSKLAEWEAKEKKARTYRRKYQQKVRAFERYLAKQVDLDKAGVMSDAMKTTIAAGGGDGGGT